MTNSDEVVWCIEVDPDLDAQIRALAAREGKSVNDIVIEAVTEYLRNRGYPL